MLWDPAVYGEFAAERGRAFDDLTARIGATQPRHVVDLGCGPGDLTASLASRWPRAEVEGIDSSPEMISSAPSGDRLSFRIGDVQSWTPPADVDVIVSNATLQWVPTHRDLLGEWAAALPSGGWLAFQVPGNFGSFSHTLLQSLAQSRRWASALTGILPADDVVGTPSEYAGLLGAAGLVPDVWETTYVHVLSGPDPVLRWMRGTALRPVMAALRPEVYGLFEQEFAAELRMAYPSTERGTLFPFRRIFAVGYRP
ncbi:MAG TPA: trans-aconitate 2-methyltransferase [Jatrophihabitans sp.]|nr:trans-aconitate 2-methyltransferase [Jatrophihabitans sp.]